MNSPRRFFIEPAWLIVIAAALIISGWFAKERRHADRYSLESLRGKTPEQVIALLGKPYEDSRNIQRIGTGFEFTYWPQSTNRYIITFRGGVVVSVYPEGVWP